MKKTALTILLFIFTANIFAQQTRGFVTARLEAKDHIALVIGNADYQDMPLANPKNDADAVSQTFRDMGFIVEEITNADKEQMAMAIDRFSKNLKTARAAVFYYSGHGIQVKGENYMIPIARNAGQQIQTEAQVPYRAVNVGEVLAAIENSNVKFSMIVLDACRNNPIKGSGRGKLKGLAAIEAPVGSMVMYATKAGDVASDGTGKNSPFTTAFLQHITTPGLDVNLLPSRVTKTVRQLTGGKQTPGTYVQLTESFTFVPEMTDEEFEALKGQLTELQAKEAEAKRQQAKEDAEIARKQAEIKALEKQIAEMKKQSANGEGDLDKMLEIMKQRKAQKAKLDAMRQQAEADRLRREKEIAEMRQKKFDETIAKYQKIASNELMQDMKQAAWNTVLKNLGLPKGSVKVDDIYTLRIKFFYRVINRRNINSYKTVKIGTQIWMAENLADKIERGCWAYDNDESNVAKYGYLYSWKAAQIACPPGWHLPSDAEWKQLEMELGMSKRKADKCGWRGNIANAMKSTSGWYNNGNGNNSSGFNALPGGYRDYYDGSFYDIGKYGFWWSSTPSGSEYVWYRYLYYNGGGVYRNDGYRTYGYSVRCIKD